MAHSSHETNENSLQKDSSVAVSVKNLSKSYGSQTVLDHVSFEIPKQSVFGIIGPNGAGKTTLFSIIAGFLKPKSGSVHVLGTNVKEISKLMGKMAMLPQDAQFQAGIPVLDQLIMFAELNGMNKKQAEQASYEALEAVGLREAAKKAARMMSHGMAKRVALCQAFIGNPEVIFLDEPTAGLDPDNAKNIRDLIRSYSKEKTIVVSSHNLSEIQNICDHVAILDQGKLVEISSMQSLVQSKNMIRVELNEEATDQVRGLFSDLACITELIPTDAKSFNLIAENTTREEALKAIYSSLIEHNIYPKSIQEGDSLESRFLEVTGGVSDGDSST